jgi:hypothetical protein
MLFQAVMKFFKMPNCAFKPELPIVFKSPHRRTCFSFVARVHGILLDIYLTSRRLLFAKTMQVFLVLFLGIFLMRVSGHSNARANESEN